MTVEVEDGSHVVLDMEGFQLVIHALRGEPAAASDATAVRPRQDSYLKVCLPVASIDAARRTAAAKGGAIKPREYEWTARGFRACDGHDPEGNIIQVREGTSVALASTS
jgi:predicted enzyme related to lactoylglutathione lyase